MRCHQNHQSRTAPNAELPGRSIPGQYGITSSPCKCYPETGEKCALYPYDKNNIVCQCGYIRSDRKIYTDAELKEIIENGTLYQFNKDHAGRKNKKTNQCEWPGCEIMVSKGYCTHHSNHITNRKTQWRLKFGNTNYDITWLTRPIRKRGNYKK